MSSIGPPCRATIILGLEDDGKQFRCMCIINNVVWQYPDGSQQPQAIPHFCERSINRQYCSDPVLIDRGVFPVLPSSTQQSRSEEQQDSNETMEENDDAPRREIVGWVRPSKHKKKESSTQKVFLRGAQFELGNVVGGSRRRRRERVWESSIAMEEVPPPAPSPPLPPAYGYPGQYQQYPPYPQYNGYPGNLMPQYPAPYQQQQVHGHQAYFQGQTTPVVYPMQATPHVLRHQVAHDQLSRLQIEHRNLAEHVKKEAHRHRKLEAKQASVLESVVQEKDSVEAQNKDLKKKLKKQAKEIEEEQRRGRTRRRNEDEMDDLVRARLPYSQRAYGEDQLNRYFAFLQAQQEQYDHRDYRDREEERELKKKLVKQREKAQEQEARIAELKREHSRLRLKQSKERKTAAWAEEQKRADGDRLYMEDLRRRKHAGDHAEPSVYDFYGWQDRFRPRRAQSQSHRYAPPTAYRYIAPERLRSYSVDARQPPPPPLHHVSKYMPPPPAYYLNAVKPQRSSSIDGSSRKFGIGGSSTSSSENQRRKMNSSISTIDASTAASTVSSSSRMGRSFSLSEAKGGKRKEYSKAKKAYVETDHEGEGDARRRTHSKGKKDGMKEKKEDKR